MLDNPKNIFLRLTVFHDVSFHNVLDFEQSEVTEAKLANGEDLHIVLINAIEKDVRKQTNIGK